MFCQIFKWRCHLKLIMQPLLQGNRLAAQYRNSLASLSTWNRPAWPLRYQKQACLTYMYIPGTGWTDFLPGTGWTDFLPGTGVPDLCGTWNRLAWLTHTWNRPAWLFTWNRRAWPLRYLKQACLTYIWNRLAWLSTWNRRAWPLQYLKQACLTYTWNRLAWPNINDVGPFSLSQIV